jgi:hypothetical protein
MSGSRSVPSLQRVVAAFLPGILLCAYAYLSIGQLPQPLSYHEFVDRRVLLGIPHAGDVMSNFAFVLVGAFGLWFLSQSRLSARSFINRFERWPFWGLFLGIFLTGFGSGWYHLQPDNDSLVWDRLPMALAFMSIFSVMITERINPSLGVALLGPLVVMGAVSVLWWIWTEHQGHGDLRWYLLVQFYPLITMILMLLLLPTPYTRGGDYLGLIVFYVAAKAAEVLDYQIFELTRGLISGHTLKHLLAALGAAWLLRMLWRRQPAR